MIPVCEPLIKDREIELVMDCLKTGWISSAGKYIDQFEESWAAYCGMKHGIAVSNGTTALQIAVELLDLQPGDEVIMPSFTIISTAQAVTRCHGVPVLVDIEPVSWQMDISQIERKITPRTRAIMVVHIYGHPADMDAIFDIARRHHLTVIEDAAEVHGAEYKGRKCGGMGDISAFSFYANKLITTGEGGMVLVQSDELAEKAQSLRNLCFIKERRFYHEELGHNFRLTNIQAALGVAQLERLPDTILKKRAIAQQYSDLLLDVPHITVQTEQPWAKSVYWVYGIVIDEISKFDAAGLARLLAEREIQTRPFFLGMHEQPVFQKMGLFRDEKYPVTEYFARRGLYLPSGLTLSENDVEYIAQNVKDILHK